MNFFPTEPKDIRKFGAIGLVFFGVLAGVALWQERPVMLGVFGGLLFLMLLFIGAPSIMRPVYLGWLKVAGAINVIVNTIILSTVFFLAVVPIGLLRRLFKPGERILHKRGSPEAETYWVRRSEPAQSRKQFLKRY